MVTFMVAVYAIAENPANREIIPDIATVRPLPEEVRKEASSIEKTIEAELTGQNLGQFFRDNGLVCEATVAFDPKELESGSAPLK